MIKNLFLFISFYLLFHTSQAQLNHCATVEHEAILKAKDPGYAIRKQQLEEFTGKIIEKQQLNPTKKMGGVITIPVVFHVVYKTAEQNIPDARLFEQIDILNEDFRRLNADAADTPDDFAAVAADCEIEFCLAQVAPDGAPTTGIIRVATDVGSFGVDDNVKFDADGGSDAWPADTYLNLWVCNLGAFLLGYAQFPGGPDATDGVVLHYLHVGNSPAGYPYHLGRTATHEVGHWLNLYHVWGDDTNCSGTDLVGDTENQKVETYGCPAFPKTDICSPDAPGIMFMNYMDYTDDACMNMFTEGQKARIQALFEPGGARYSILSAEVCSLEAFDAQAINAAPVGFTCSTTIDPVITIRNGGSETLLSLDINYAVDGGSTSLFTWTGSLATGAEEEVTLPSIVTTEGAHSITAILANPNGNPDGDAGDNTTTTEFTVTLTGNALPLEQGFESTGFPYEGYTLYNPDAYYTWERTNDAASIGTYSVYINHYDNDAPGEIDDFTLPPYDFTGYVEAHLSFDVAYALYTASGEFSDTLEVLVSADCGETWTEVYKKFNPDLQTAPHTTSSFVPADDEWRNELIDLTSFAGESLVYIKFRTVSDYENNLYVDNININDDEQIAINTIDELTKLHIYPNPASEEMQLEFSLYQAEEIELSIYNVLGEIVFHQKFNGITGKNIFTVPVSILANGNYKLQLSNEGRNTTTTFLKN